MYVQGHPITEKLGKKLYIWLFRLISPRYQIKSKSGRTVADSLNGVRRINEKAVRKEESG